MGLLDIVWGYHNAQRSRGLGKELLEQGLVLRPGASQDETKVIPLKTLHKIQGIIPFQDLVYPVEAGVSRNSDP